jgi:hypothetical protein
VNVAENGSEGIVNSLERPQEFITTKKHPAPTTPIVNTEAENSSLPEEEQAKQILVCFKAARP